MDCVETFDVLASGSALNDGKYTVQDFLSSGGWGKVYIGTDHEERKVVIKECFPAGFCTRDGANVVATSARNKKILELAIKDLSFEAKSSSYFNLPSVVSVNDFFEENGTGYIVMDYVVGSDLQSFIDEGNRLSPVSFKWFVDRILNCVEHLHGKNTLHCDISPDNIVLRSPEDPVLIDFGAARYVDQEHAVQSSRMFFAKPGYSAIEVSDAPAKHSVQSDIYALAATMYFALTGTLPPDAKARQAAVKEGKDDPLLPLVGRLSKYEEPLLASIDKALSIEPQDRFASVSDWHQELPTGEKVVPITKSIEAEAPQQDRKPFPFQHLAASVGFLALAGAGYMAVTGDEFARAPMAHSASSIDLMSPAAFAEVDTVNNVALLTYPPSVSAAPTAPVLFSPIAEPTMPQVSNELSVPNISMAAFDVLQVSPVDEPQVEHNHLVIDLPVQAASLDLNSEASNVPTVNVLQPSQDLSIVHKEWHGVAPFTAEMTVSPSGKPAVQIISVSEVLAVQTSLRPGAIIVSLNGQPVRNTSDLNAIMNAVRNEGEADHVYSFYIATAGTDGHGQQASELVFADRGHLVLSDGAEIEALLVEKSWQLRVVRANAESAFDVDDVISAANDIHIGDMEELVAHIEQTNSGQMEMAVMRDGKEVPVTLNLAKW